MKKTVSFILIFSLILCFAACAKDKVQEDVTASSDAAVSAVVPNTSAVILTETTSFIADNTQTQPTDTAETTTLPAENTTAAEATTSAPVSDPTTSAPAAEATTAPAGNTKAEILQTLADAVNKTKAYSSPITVAHKEAFNIVEPVVTLDKAESISGMVTKVVSFVKDLVLKPSEETYSFSGGTAKTSEGETTQLLLPKDKAFSLSADAVASASVSDENGMKHIVLTLTPEETHSLAEIPVNHSNSIGYLDLDGSFSILKIDSIDIKYPGSVIDAYIRSDGYVQSVTYTINLEAEARAHGMGISGSATFSGSQTETWNVNWQ